MVFISDVSSPARLCVQGSGGCSGGRLLDRLPVASRLPRIWAHAKAPVPARSVAESSQSVRGVARAGTRAARSAVS